MIDVPGDVSIVSATTVTIRSLIAIELTTTPGSSVQPVLYGPSVITLHVQTSDTLSQPHAWIPIGTFPLTNSFRILPTESFTNPLRFFQADEL